MAGRLDEQQLAELRTWASTLLSDDRADLRAAGRGLILLADEVERLWLASRTAFAEDVSGALAHRLGTAEPDAHVD